MNFKGLTISQLGDTAIIINFENKIDKTLNSKVLHLFKKLKKIALPFVRDIVPGYSSLVIFYDLLIMKSKNPINKTCIEIITDQLKKIMEEDLEISSLSRRIKIPVCYAEKYAWDINEISKEKNIPVDEIIRLHTAKKYRVYMIGFLPGFAYMGEVDKQIAIPRKMQPRNKVEAGSVGIAGLQTGIYPLDSPGGWQIIGKTPLKLFTKENDDPVLLQPGDEIEFYSITEDEFTNY
ncbi:MAG TPA: 5-oxoprolinase subunit PxpB [Chitinophagaceae bacterium]|nr:5-oxoprolinase subunit PxpB [Chitinophagaceae bacterium]